MRTEEFHLMCYKEYEDYYLRDAFIKGKIYRVQRFNGFEFYIQDENDRWLSTDIHGVRNHFTEPR
ncbi:hypothetical protein UT300012_33020 [Paraclostridium bifermentans]